MQRLKNLDVHEISLVKAGANRKKYLVLKSDAEAQMTDSVGQAPRSLGDKLAEAFGKIPRTKLEDAELVIAKARSAVRKADDGTEGGLPADDDTQEALRAAFKLLAAHADQLNADTMADFVAALGIEADDPEDDAADEEAQADGAADVAASKDGDTIGPEVTEDKPATQKADDSEDDDKAQKADDDASDEDKAEKADDAPADKDKDEAQKDGAPEGMPDFAEAGADDIDAAMAAARKAYADAMLQRGKKQASDDAEDDSNPFKKSAVAKSSILKGLSPEQQAFLEPIFKAHEDRVANLEKAHKELIAKSQKAEKEAQHRAFVQKAAKHYAHLGPAEEVGAGLMRMHERDPDNVAAWEAILKSANQRAAEGGETHLFAELGSNLAMPSGMTAEDELKEAVSAIVQKSDQSREKAEAAFLQTPQGRAIYNRMQRQKRN